MHLPARADAGERRRTIHLAMMTAALALLTGACATSGGVPKPFPGATGPTAAKGATGAADAPIAPLAPVSPLPSDLGPAVAQFAMGFRGVPYRLGGADPAGFDCSGLVQYVFAQYGVAVPRIVEQQYEVGRKIRPRDIRPGDLLFFDTNRRGGGASHVGIAIAQNSFVHAPNSTGVVRVETLGHNYWGERYLGARRIEPRPLAP